MRIFLAVLIFSSLCAFAPESFAASPAEATDESFDKLVLQSSVPVVLEFWSPNCGHCLKMTGVMDELASELSGKAVVVKVNVLENRRKAVEYGIQAVPAFFLIEDGKVSGSAMGAMTGRELMGRLGLD